MKLKGEWLVLAERVLTDAHSNNLTLVSCLEQIGSPVFPGFHHGFGVAALYRCVDAPPADDVPVTFRLMRCSDTDGEVVVQTHDTTWKAGLHRARLATNFAMLRLWRPEVITFRMDHKVHGGRWTPGPSCSLEVYKVDLTPEQQAAMQAQLKELMAPRG